MSEPEILALLSQDLDSVAGVVGVNYHMGSKASQDSRVMTIILRELKRRGLFFVDSRVVSGQLPLRLAKEIGLPSLARDVFIDNEDDVEYVKGQLRELLELALQRGRAVGIGHVYHEATRTAIQEMKAEFAQKGVAFVPLTAFLPAKGGARLADSGSGNLLR